MVLPNPEATRGGGNRHGAPDTQADPSELVGFVGASMPNKTRVRVGVLRNKLVAYGPAAPLQGCLLSGTKLQNKEVGVGVRRTSTR